MKIGIDIDSTLYDFAIPMRQAFLDLALEHGDKEEYFKGGYQSWVEWRSPADVCGPEAFELALAKVHSEEIIAQQVPFNNSVEVCKRIAENYEILYISNRAPETVWATQHWLDDHNYPSGELVCTMRDKQEYLRDCQYLIDDRPKTLVEFVYASGWNPPAYHSRPRKAFGLLYEYNRALTDIPNVYLAPTWAGINYYLERKGVLECSPNPIPSLF